MISAGGSPRLLLDAARHGKFELCTSEVLLSELLDVLSRSKFAARLVRAGMTPEGLVGELRRMAMVVLTPAIPPQVVPTDPDDGHVIAAAIAGAVDLISSGDKRNLLRLGMYRLS